LYKAPVATLFLGHNLVFVPACHSTNSLALQLCQQAVVPEGTVVITENQTAGRGQRGNSWEAQPGLNLTLSIIIRPGFMAVADQFYFNLITSLAVQDYLKSCVQSKPVVKWPNDILVDGEKICGILIENQLHGNRFASVVMGIGLNINQQQFTSATATSLSRITGKQYNLQTEFEKLLQYVEARYLQLKSSKYEELKQAYLANLYRLGEAHPFEIKGMKVMGTITGIDAAGQLLVSIDGEVRAFGIKEIQFVE